MANTIDQVYVDTFENNVRHIAQQKKAKLMSWAQVRGEESENHNWELLSSGNAAVKTTRLQATPVADIPWGRRVAVAQTWDWGESTEQEDPVQMIVDPNSNLTMTGGYAMARACDDVLITAATADALNGDGTTTAVGAGQIVGDYSTEIDFDTITNIQEIFMENDIDPDVPKVAVVGSKQTRKLMQLTEQTSSDYVKAQALQDYGIVPNWLGFTWINSTRLNVPAADQKDCLFFTKSALGMNIPKNITARVQEDPSISFAWRIYLFTVMSAVRVQDEHLVWFKAADTV